MDFSFSQDQELFRRTVRQFAQDVLLPEYSRWDKTGDGILAQRPKVAELGLLGMRLPERFGGTNADLVTVGIAIEEFGRADLSCASMLTHTIITGALLDLYAPDEIKDQILPRLIRGETTLCMGLTEPHCGSDAAAIASTGVRDGDDYVLTGEKASITWAMHASAAIVYVKTDPSAGARGVSCFYVPTDTPGFSRSGSNDIGCRAQGRGSLFMDRVRVPASNMLGREGRGFQQIMNQFDYSRALIGLQTIGLVQQTMDETIEYVKTRNAFGQPIARYQGVAFPIVEQATLLEAARLLCYKSLWLRDQNLPHVKESAMVKWWVPKIGFETVHQMLLLYGHAGYGDDYPLGQRLRDVLSRELTEGAEQIMKRIIAREVFGRDLVPA